MIRASTRYVPHIVVLLVLASIPTWLHWTSSFDVEDCADSEALLPLADVLADDSAGGKEPDPRSIRRRFLSLASPDGRWAEGRIPLADSDDALEFVIVRSFDAKLLYHWPAARLHWKGGESMRVDRHDLEILETGSYALPIHRGYYDLLEAQSGRIWVIAYLLVYDSRPVSNPYLAQLLSAPLQLVRGRTPMWLFFVSGEVQREHQESAEQAAREWLADVWERYGAACRP